jgi:hypothetical protein
MEKEIVNRVAQSKLVTIDLEDFYPKEERVRIDLKGWLHEGLILKEKEFRALVSDHDWTMYRGKYVHVVCSSDAIIPSWAYLLLSISLAPYALKTVIGSSELLEDLIFEQVIRDLPVEDCKDVPVIIKGCSSKKIPETAYASLVQKILPLASSVMFGEACSSVPLHKKKK